MNKLKKNEKKSISTDITQNENLLTEETKKIKEIKKYINIKTIIMIILIVIVLGVVYFNFFNKEGQTTISSKSELIKVLDVSELSAAEYTYNGIATKMTKDNKVAYYVSYEGIVKAGIDFKDIKYEENPKTKTIVITLPEIQIFDKIVDASNVDIMYIDERAKTETVHQEAFNLSVKALENSITTDTNFYDKTQENVISIIRATLEPLISAKDNEYKLEIK